MSIAALPPSTSLSPFPLEILLLIVATLKPAELVPLLRVNSCFHSAVVEKVYEHAPAVALKRRRHSRPPLRDPVYASHVRVLDVSIGARRCCRPHAIALPKLEVLRLHLAQHTQTPPHWREWGTGDVGRAARLPRGLSARTLVFRFPLSGGAGRRVSLSPPPERTVLFLSMPSSVFDMEPLPLLLSKELPAQTKTLALVLECPRQPEMVVDVMHALFQLAEYAASAPFAAAYPHLARAEVVVPDYVFSAGCRDVVQNEVRRLMRATTATDGPTVGGSAGKRVTVGLQLASEFLGARGNELILTDKEKEAYWHKSRPRRGKRTNTQEVAVAVAQAKRLMTLAGAVWNTLIDNYDEILGEDSEDDDGGVEMTSL